MSETDQHDDRPANAWPPLPLAQWQDTYDTLHMWTQIVGKVRLAQTPLVNHWWNVPLYVDARGLTTSAVPYEGRAFELRFDFESHVLVLETSDDDVRSLPLAPCTVADFYDAFMRMLGDAGIHVAIWPMPVEVPDPIRFDQDRTHASYDRGAVQRFFRVLTSVAQVLEVFRARFIGKCSPVHFFWGSFDLAVTRFSGRLAPERPGADAITREAYSHEVSSVGFWPGSGSVTDAAFYAYAAPEPKGFAERAMRPSQARYDRTLGEFLLMYDAVRTADSPTRTLLDFCQSTYVAAADLAQWDRAALERAPK
ncbi:MAG TPA: DUF5996 family protein [Casimicrobiaceae bacterium]|nr:DUF5996 family protein [Casimicrobiaceae bacterium]